MSQHTNKRVDEFGGSFYNRMKFAVEVIKDMRKKVGGSFPIIFRMSGDEKVVDGRDVEESKAVASIVEDVGVNAVHVSTGVYGSMPYVIPPTDVPPGFNLANIGEIKKAVSIPVIGVGRINDLFWPNKLSAPVRQICSPGADSHLQIRTYPIK